jgi:hypothetical protein
MGGGRSEQSHKQRLQNNNIDRLPSATTYIQNLNPTEVLHEYFEKDHEGRSTVRLCKRIDRS